MKTVNVNAYDCVNKKPTTVKVSVALKKFLDKKLGVKTVKGS